MNTLKELYECTIVAQSKGSFWGPTFASMVSTYRLANGYSSFDAEYEAVILGDLEKKAEKVYQTFRDLGLRVSMSGFGTDPFGVIHDEDYDIPCLVMADIRSKTISFRVVGDKEHVVEKIAKLKVIFSSSGKLCTSFSRIDDKGDASTSTLVIKNKELKPPNPAFYPYIDGIDTIADEFNNSSSNLLFLIGPAGTGKTSFVRGVMGNIDRKLYSVTSAAVVCHEDLPTVLMDEVAENSLTLIEDADHILGKRREGNEKLSGILNILSGLTEQNKKMIITTNLETVKDVDEALLRPGRTFRTIMFRPLTTIEANAARASIGLSELGESDFKHISQSKGITLAEALNFEEYMKTHKSQKVGF